MRQRLLLLTSASPVPPALSELLLRCASTHDLVACLPIESSLPLSVPHLKTDLPREPADNDVVVTDAASLALHPEVHALVRSAALGRNLVLLTVADYAAFPLTAVDAEANARAALEQTSRIDALLVQTLQKKDLNCLTCPSASGLHALLSAMAFPGTDKPLHVDDAAAWQYFTRSLGDVEDEFGEWTVVVAVNGPLFVAVSPWDAKGESPYVFPSEVRAAARAFAVHACEQSPSAVQTVFLASVSRRFRVVEVTQASLAPAQFASAEALLAFMVAPASAVKTLFPTTAPSRGTPVRAVRIALMGSTPGGTSAQPLLDALGPSRVVLALSNKADAGVLRRAKEAGVAAALHVPTEGRSKAEFETRVADEIERRGVDLIVLVGYMRLLSPEFCSRFANRIVNVHPSLLPLHKGKMDLQVHEAVLAAGEAQSGCSVHVVTAEVDAGPVVVQKRCPVVAGDTPASLKARVQTLEGLALLEAVARFDAASATFPTRGGLTYADAGVDIHRGDLLVDLIKPACKATRRRGCVDDVGGFGAVFSLEGQYVDPILVSGTDGVGTKLLLAQQLKQLRGVGIDLVAMSVNDVLVQGAEPLFFLDYYASAKLNVPDAVEVIRGIARGCAESGCALVGGETAELPDMYPPGAYDLAGFCLGAVERTALLPRVDAMQAGDVLIGLPSSGLHSNGFSLVRKLLKRLPESILDLPPPFASLHSTLGEALLEPTRLYVKAVKRALATSGVLGLAHITGGGIAGNLPRVLPEHLRARVDLQRVSALHHGPGALWTWLRTMLSEAEMLETFNCGVGMILVCARASVQQVLAVLDDGVVIGELDVGACAVVFEHSLFAASTPAPSMSALTYKSAGVDVAEGDSLVERIKPSVTRTTVPGCMGGLGGFGALFDMKAWGPEALLVAGTDGVGTKLLLAMQSGLLAGVGVDLVAMSVNDLLVQGATPLFFLDYYACGKLDVAKAAMVVEGVCDGCVQSGCALVGGETAEMPDMYHGEDFDVAGFAVGAVRREQLLPRPVRAGDVLVGVPSNGLHSNGYSLVRRVLAKHPTGAPAVDVLMRPTTIYVNALRPLLAAGLVEAMAHITGSGMPGNIPRVLDSSLAAVVDLGTWQRSSDVWTWLAKHVAPEEMLDTFNCGFVLALACVLRARVR